MLVAPRPYVGITGFMNPKEVQDLFELMPAPLFENRDLMVGVLVSSKTMWGQTNKWPGRYPLLDSIGRIFYNVGNRINIIHYNTENPERLFRDMLSITERIGPAKPGSSGCCHGFQLNVTWPDVNQLSQYRSVYPDARVILQLGKGALDQTGWDPAETLTRLKDYIGPNGPVTDVLYDPSGGHGMDVNLMNAAPLFELIGAYAPHVGIGGAGELRAERLFRLAPLFEKFPNLSIDAEGQLRSPEGEAHKGFSQLDLLKAYAYTAGALSMFAPNAI